MTCGVASGPASTTAGSPAASLGRTNVMIELMKSTRMTDGIFRTRKRTIVYFAT